MTILLTFFNGCFSARGFITRGCRVVNYTGRKQFSTRWLRDAY